MLAGLQANSHNSQTYLLWYLQRHSQSPAESTMGVHSEMKSVKIVDIEFQFSDICRWTWIGSCVVEF